MRIPTPEALRLSDLVGAAPFMPVLASRKNGPAGMKPGLQGHDRVLKPRGNIRAIL